MLYPVTIEHIMTLYVEECCECGTAFGMTERLQKQLRSSGNIFYCPVGHPQHYTQSTEEQLKQAKSKIKQLEQSEIFWRSQAEEKAEDLKKTKTELTRTKNRVSKGVCPCCNRQFIQLERHMKTKHPEYNK